MQVKIQYKYVAEVIDFLSNISLKGKQSIHRTRFIKLVNEKLKQISEEELELVKEFTGIDEEGNPKKNEMGNFDIKDASGFLKQQKEYFEECYVIEGGDAHGMLKTMKAVIENYDQELSGKDAEVFEHLFTAFENSNEKGEEE